MLKSRLERFVAKRVLIFLIILSIIDIVLMNKRWPIFFGLIAGGALGVLRFSSNAALFKRLLATAADYGEAKHAGLASVIFFVFNQIILVLLLFVFYKISSWLFAGLVAGIMLVPLVLMVNGITEALKITHNNFE